MVSENIHLLSDSTTVPDMVKKKKKKHLVEIQESIGHDSNMLLHLHIFLLSQWLLAGKWAASFYIHHTLHVEMLEVKVRAH